jgi:hypothetical protein
MKFLVLLCLVGYALTSPTFPEWRGVYWKPNTEYVFEYTGRLLTGIPELASHYSGVSIKCKVHLNVVKEGMSYKFGIHITDPKYVRVNDVLHGSSHMQEGGDNWRFVELPEYSDLPSEHSQKLSDRVVLKLKETGEFEVLIVKEDEPEWSINFKKALATLFQTKFGSDEQKIAQELVQNNELLRESGEGEVVTWTTTEESLDGNCEVNYQLNELPSYVVKDLPKIIPYPEECPRLSEGGKYFELVKTRDISSCSKYTSFQYYKPGFLRCPNGNCEGMWTRSSVTRYTACGSVEKLNIQTITNEGELQQNLFGFKTEKFLTGTRQVMKLISTRSSSSEIITPVSSRVYSTLFYEYSTELRSIFQQHLPEHLEQIREEDKSAKLFKTLPRNILTTGNNHKSIEPEKLIPEMKRLFKEMINEDFFNMVDLPKKQITMKALNIARSFSLLSKDQIHRVYEELKGEFSEETKRTMFKNVFFDTLVMGGSNENILFIKEKISSGELSKVQIISIFAFLPHYVMVPREILLNNLYELITSHEITSDPTLFNHATLSFSILLQRACLADNRKTSYPTFVYGEFCHPDSSVITEKWLPFLSRELEHSSENYEKKHVIITAFSLMSHKNIIPIVLPYIEGTSSSPSEMDPETRMTRFLAVYSLTNCGRKNPEMVMPILVSVFTNMAEETNIRVAAFNVIMKLHPSMTVMHAIASSTWYEKNTEILNIVNTAFFTLSQQIDAAHMSRSSESLQHKAWLVYPLIKKVGGRFPTSGAIYNSEYLRGLGVGYEYVTSWTANEQSIIPSNIYTKLVYFLDRYEVSPVEYGLYLKGGESIVQELVQILTSSKGEGSYESKIVEQVKEQLHSEWRKAIDELDIKTRDSDKPTSAFYLNLFEDYPLFRTFKSSSSQILKEKVMSVLQKGKDKVCGSTPVNFQRMHDLTPAEFTVPSDMGLPMVIEVHMPVTVSARGEMTVDCDSSMPSMKMNVRYMYATQLSGWVGTICPFTEEYLVTGVDEHAVINLPTDFDISLNMREMKLNMKLKPVSSVTGPTDLFHFHVRPFGVVQSYYNLTPMTLSNKVKFIESDTHMKNMEYPYGEKLGLNLKAVINTESKFVDLRSVFERLWLYNYNPLNIFRFSWASTALNGNGLPSLRRHEWQIKYDPTSSSTKEIEFQFQLSTVSKEQGEEIKTHKVVVDHEKIVPYKIVKEPISAGVVHVEKLKQMLEKSEIKVGSGFFLRLSTILKGSRPRSWNYNCKLVVGQESYLKSKWNIHLEDESDSNKICVDGELSLPNLPIWNVEEMRNSNMEVHFRNEIGLGDCSQSKIVATGESRVSREQKEYSKISPDAKILKKMVEKNVPLTELSEVADRVRVQASTLNEVDFRIQYENVPEVIIRRSNIAFEMVKSWWWPYIVENNEGYSPNHVRSSSMTTTYKMVFIPGTKTFDLFANRPHETIVFKHIRIPYPLTYFFPLTTLRNPVSTGIKAVVGKPLHPICSLEKEWLKTYDNRTTKVHLDDCFHLLSADCSLFKRFSVMVRNLKHNTESKEMKIFIGKTWVLMTPSERHSRYSSEVKIQVNGTEKSIRTGEVFPVKDRHGEVIFTMKKSVNGVIELNSRWIKVTFDGYKTQLETSVLIKDKLCGLCGDLNDQKQADLRGPKKCVYSKPELLSASYRVSLPSHTCEPLPSHIKQELREEEELCAKYKIVPTKVAKSFSVSSGECTGHKHEIIERSSKLCFSRKPVPFCSIRCKPASGEEVNKSVSFTCMEKNRVAKLYEEKILLGKIIPELQNLPETFSVETRLPKVCVPVNNRI